jgi:hypothetical protein
MEAPSNISMKAISTKKSLAMYENGIERIAGENVENGSAAIENGNKWRENESGVENHRKFGFGNNFKIFIFAARIEE